MLNYGGDKKAKRTRKVIDSFETLWLWAFSGARRPFNLF